MMTRAEHLDWCKERALEYCNRGDFLEAFASFQSDMSKHPDTENHRALEMGSILMLGGHLKTADQIEGWVTGFN